MLKEDFNELLAVVQGINEGKAIDMKALMRATVKLFDKLKHELDTGTPKEKLEAVALMRRMHEKLLVDTQKIAARVGMTEDQLLDYLDKEGHSILSILSRRILSQDSCSIWVLMLLI